MSAEYTSVEVLDIEELTNSDLPVAADDVSVAMRLGFKPRTMWWLIHKPDAAYDQFEIPKANGKMRVIHAPSATMKLLLRNARRVFLKPMLDGMGEHVTAYRTGKGIREAVAKHIHPCPVCDEYDVPHTCNPVLERVGKSYHIYTSACKACEKIPPHKECARRGVKVHMDLKDFFSNTKASWIRDYIQEEMGYNKRTANVLASLMTTPLTVKHGTKEVTVRGVPQGAPTSGDICNLVAERRLDDQIRESLSDTKWRYSRYADDLYFSHPENLGREQVDDMLARVKRCVHLSGWRTNPKKQDIQRPGRTQRLLGTTINQKPNIPAEQYKKIRHMLYRCWRDGFVAEASRQGKTAPKLVSWLTGKLAWFNCLNTAKTAKLKAVFEDAKEKHKYGKEQT